MLKKAIFAFDILYHFLRHALKADPLLINLIQPHITDKRIVKSRVGNLAEVAMRSALRSKVTDLKSRPAYVYTVEVLDLTGDNHIL